jgi:hypothetical protein
MRYRWLHCLPQASRDRSNYAPDLVSNIILQPLNFLKNPSPASVFVTSASKGIGAGVAIALAHEGVCRSQLCVSPQIPYYGLHAFVLSEDQVLVGNRLT